jgi:hypothetical protein
VKKLFVIAALLFLMLITGCERNTSGSIRNGPTGGQWMVVKGGLVPVYLTEVKTPSGHKYCLVISVVYGGYAVSVVQVREEK